MRYPIAIETGTATAAYGVAVLICPGSSLQATAWKKPSLKPRMQSCWGWKIMPSVPKPCRRHPDYRT